MVKISDVLMPRLFSHAVPQLAYTLKNEFAVILHEDMTSG